MRRPVLSKIRLLELRAAKLNEKHREIEFQAEKMKSRMPRLPEVDSASDSSDSSSDDEAKSLDPFFVLLLEYQKEKDHFLQTKQLILDGIAKDSKAKRQIKMEEDAQDEETGGAHFTELQRCTCPFFSFGSNYTSSPSSIFFCHYSAFF